MPTKPDESEPRTAIDQPTPTQAEADMIKTAAHGEGPESPQGAPVNVDVPYVSGSGTVGTTLEATLGNWQGEPTEYAGEWLSDGATHLGVGSMYTIQDTDVGHGITCVVTATNAFGSTTAPPSNVIMIT